MSHCASAAAIFMGWNLVSLIPSLPPKNSTRAAAGRSTARATVADLRKAGTCRHWRRCQAEMPTRNVPATAKPPETVCVKAAMAVLLLSSAQIEVSRGMPSTSSMPTGCCIHEFADRMK